MEMELEPRAKPLTFQVKATSRESTPQKATHVLDCDIRTHWSTGTNTKEWILLELDEPCLLSHLRIYNKSVFEWEISVGLQYKPEAFVKVRPRCDAPRRDMVYPMSYTPCRFVRVACLRGNPIAIYFIQLIGVSVTGLEPEFQPIVNYLLPHIICHKQEDHDLHFQLLQDITSRLLVFLPQLETDLANFTDEDVRFFAMLAGPFYPILHILKEREIVKQLTSSDPDFSKTSQTSTLMVSSNFETQTRRSRSPSFTSHMSCSVAFRPDALLLLLKKAYKDPLLRTVCFKASKVLHMLVKPTVSAEGSKPVNNSICSSNSDEVNKNSTEQFLYLSDYSSLFGETFKLQETCEDATYFNLLDIAAVEEGIIHALHACASEPLLCSKLADSNTDILSVLPLVQALLPALRPPFGCPDKVDDTFSQWKHNSIQNALSQIVLMASSSVYRPLVRACAGYLSSFSSTHIKAACLLIDLCCGPLSPWISIFVDKVDLAVELVEDLLLDIQGASRTIQHARAVLKFIILALSGNMDDVLTKYKENKHKLLFLLEMLEAFLDPVLTSVKSSISFGDASTVFSEEDEIICAISLNIIRIAAQRPAVLSSLELEWRSGSLVPSVLLSILGPNITLPPDIDLCKCSTSTSSVQESHSIPSGPSEFGENICEPVLQIDTFEDLNILFAPQELKKTSLINSSYKLEHPDKSMESRHSNTVWKMSENPLYHLQLDNSFFVEFFNTQADYLKLLDHHDCESMSSEFQKLAMDLFSHHDIAKENHDAVIDALLLAAECYVNPFFLVSVRPASKLMDQLTYIKSKITNDSDIMQFGRNSQNDRTGSDKIARLEPKRDKAVLQLLLKAAKLNAQYQGEETQDECDLHSIDLQSADVVTLIRKNQEMLHHFTMQQLQKENHLSHEILLQSLLLLLHSATELFSSPEDVIDVILQSAEKLNGMFTSLYYQIKEGNTHFDIVKLHVLQRRWVLLQRLVLASSGDSGTNAFKDGTTRFQYKCLIPPSSWMHKISEFSKNQHLLPRFLGWMAVSRYAKLYLSERLFLASELSQLTSLLTIFTDELALVNNVGDVEYCKSSVSKDSFVVLYPDLHKFFPNMKEQFGNFGEIILEAVSLQIKCLPSSVIPDLLCWFSDICMWPYLCQSNEKLKGYNAINARAIVLYLLESIVSEHMEAIILEMPHLAQILISLCGGTFCDVAFLNAILRVLQPLISYFMRKEIIDGKTLNNEISSCDFEVNFKELFDYTKCRMELQECPGKKYLQGPLVIFVLGALFPYFSIKRKIEILQSLVDWVDFTASEPTSSYLDHLCAFLKLVDSCHILLVQNLKPFDILKLFQNDDSSTSSQSDDCDGNISYDISDQHFYHLLTDDIEQLLQTLQLIILKLSPALENSWELHCQLSSKLTYNLCKCYLLSRCLHSVGQKSDTPETHEGRSKHWQKSLEGLAEVIITTQKNQCWQVCSAMLDYLFKLPCTIPLDCVLSDICSAIKHFYLSAPKISWRMQTDKWFSYLFTKNIKNLDGNVTPVVDLISSMLTHWEPEQRSIAMQHLGMIVCLDNNNCAESSKPLHESLVPVSVVSTLVTNTWDRIATLALSDPSMMLRSHATALLSGCIPLVDRSKLQSFLVSTNTILRSIGKLSLSLEECFVTRLLLGLLANVCLYSPSEDIKLIPESVWQNLENVGMSKTGGLDDADKKLCQVLCKLKTDPDGAHEELKCALSTSSTARQSDPNFRSTKESILQVLSSLTSIQSYFDFFSKKADQTRQELDEAEIEMELLMKEKALEEVTGNCVKEKMGPLNISVNKDDESRLQKIKDGIKSLERSRLSEEIAARRQKKLLMRCVRHKILEEAASREMQLLQEIDRERTVEMERTMEREKQLELERAKTKELQFNLDMEKERQTQKELQRELEQVESGVRLPRREFSSNSNSRPRERERERERYRDRDNHNRHSNRSSECISSQTAAAGPATSPARAAAMPGSRSFSGQLPTILQPRDRAEERSGNANYEDFAEGGSRDSGDGGSVGDPESGSAFDGFGPAQRHGQSRGGKSRQVGDRREKDGRRDGGKWERRN